MRVHPGLGPLVQAARENAQDDLAHVPEVLRAARTLPDGERFLHVRVPPRLVAFSRSDSHRPQFAAAAEVARAAGFPPTVRHVGGAFAPLHEGSLVIDHYGTSADAARSTVARFEEHSEVLRRLLAGMGLDARVGQVAGEYCPGDHSVNVAGRVKVAGVAQRVSGSAWIVSTVLQVSGAERLRGVTVDVARELGEHVDPATIGDLAGEGVELSVPEVARDVVVAFSAAGLVAPRDVLAPGPSGPVPAEAHPRA